MKNIIIILLLILPFSFFSQNQKKQEAIEIAQNQIQQLKSGVLLVRLYNKKNVINVLEEKGMMRRAETLRDKYLKINKNKILSFSDFSFCQVYFFYSSFSSDLINGNYDINLDSNFFVADFGVLQNNNSRESNSLETKKTGRTKVKRYKGGQSNTEKKCLFLRDNTLTQVKNPFPFKVWLYPHPFNRPMRTDGSEIVIFKSKKIKNSVIKKAVMKLDEELKEFYSKNK